MKNAMRPFTASKSSDLHSQRQKLSILPIRTMVRSRDNGPIIEIVPTSIVELRHGQRAMPEEVIVNESRNLMRGKAVDHKR